MARSGFKMKYSPAKGKLDNFFSSLGKQLKRNKKSIKNEMDRKYGHGEYKGNFDRNDGVYTEWEKDSKGERTGRGTVRKPRQKPGESKYQYNVRMKKYGMSDSIQAPEKAPKGKETVSTEPKSKATVSPEPKSKAYVPQEFKGAPGDKYRYRVTGETVVGDDTYSNFEFMKPGSNTWTKAGENKGGGHKGFNAIYDLHEKAEEEGTLFDSPIDKKSTTKKKGFKMPGYGKRK